MTRYLFAAFTEAPHLGSHLVDGAQELGLSPLVAAPKDVWRGSRWTTRFYWHLLDKRGPGMAAYEQEVLRIARTEAVGTVITTGLAPLRVATLRDLRRLGTVTANFATDDPWNPVNGARWFLRALPLYDVVFTPRRANVDDLVRLGCRRVEYLPFAYEPTIHFPEDRGPEVQDRYQCDVAFVGGGDPDRVPYVDALVTAGIDVHVYGGLWDRYPHLRSRWGGHVLGHDYRQAVAGAKVQLCLVRRANRDSHVMRSFELPAMRSCILAEDTAEHREIYGPPSDERVAFFDSPQQMVAEARRLLSDEPLRRRTAQRVFQRVVVESRNTYRDRVATMSAIIEQLRSP